MGQYQYFLKQDPEEREKEICACMETIFIHRCKSFENEVWQAYNSEKQKITESFELAVSKGAEQAKDMIDKGEKGPIRYIHFSYLGSNALADEMLVRLDYYDEKHFSDISDIDCYWDYHYLFPCYAEEQKKLEKALKENVNRLTSLELQKALIFYQIWNFMALEKVIQYFVKTETVEKILRSCSDIRLSFYFGAYLDQAKRIHKLER